MSPLVTTFAVSGFAIALLIVAKAIEERRRKPLIVLNIVSRGDAYIRERYHAVVHLYCDAKEKIVFFFQKQIPLRLRNIFNKLISYLKEKQGQYTANMRDSRLLKRSDGISEFYRNLSNVEKGNGEINDTYVETIAEAAGPVPAVAQEDPKPEEKAEVIEEQKRPAAKRKRKVKVAQ